MVDLRPRQSARNMDAASAEVKREAAGDRGGLGQPDDDPIPQGDDRAGVSADQMTGIAVEMEIFMAHGAHRDQAVGAGVIKPDKYAETRNDQIIEEEEENVDQEAQPQSQQWSEPTPRSTSPTDRTSSSENNAPGSEGHQNQQSTPNSQIAAASIPIQIAEPISEK